MMDTMVSSGNSFLSSWTASFFGDAVIVGSADFNSSGAYFAVDDGDFVRESGIWDED